MNYKSDVIVNVSCLQTSRSNSTPSAFRPCEPPYGLLDGGQTENQWLFLILSVVPFGTLFGNGLVIMAVACQRNLRNISNRVIASLAFTDFLLALFVVPLGIYQLVRGEWNLGLHLCIVWTGSDVILSTASIMHLCSIALYRYRGIAHPFRCHRRSGVSYLIVPAWMVSVTLSIPFIIQAIHDPNNVLERFSPPPEERFLCGIYNRTFTTYSSLVSFFIPLVVMSTVDILSVQTLRRQAKLPRGGAVTSSPERVTLEESLKTGADGRRKRFEEEFYEEERKETRMKKKRLVGPEESCSSCSIHAAKRDSCSDLKSKKAEPRYEPLRRTNREHSPATPDSRRSDFSKDIPVHLPGEERKSLSTETTPLSRPRSKSLFYLDMLASGGSFKINGRERRAERTLIWVFAVFVTLWLPFFSANLIYGICSTCNVPPALFQTFVWLGYLSSGVNPCIYTLLNRDFRTAFHRILTCRRQSFRREIIMSHTSVRTFRRANQWTPPVYLHSYRGQIRN